MLSIWAQLKLLLWKGFVIKKKQKIWILVEIAIPVLLFALLVLIRTRNFDVLSDTCHYDAKAFPSGGLLPFMHSFLCSFSNDCQQTPSTDDDKTEINKRSARESIVIQTIRWLTSFFEIIGRDPNRWGTVFYITAELIHEIALFDKNGNIFQAFPVSSFFDSNSKMVDVLVSDFGYDRSTAQKFLNISLTPNFFFDAYNEFADVQRSNESWGTVFRPIGFLCNQSLVDQSFVSLNGEHTNVDLCNRITYMNLFIATFSNDLNMSSMAANFIKHTFPSKDDNFTTQIQMVIESFRLLSEELPPIDFGVFNDSQKLLDAVFCGNFQDTTGHTSGTSSSVKPNFLLQGLQQKIVDFIRKLTPGRTDHKGVRYCGNISIFDDSKCKFFDAYGMSVFKPLLYGYILVTPNVSSVRNLVEKLNYPLKLANFLSDNIKDYNQVADSLQDSLSESDLAKASHVISTWFNMTRYEHFLDLFHNSSDPNSLFELVKTLTEHYENISECVRFDRFIMVENETEMENLAVCLSDYQQYLTGIVFSNFTDFDYEIGPFTSYKIRHHPALIDSTNAIMDSRRRVTARDNPLIDIKYLTFGFSFLQEAIDKHLIEMVTNHTIPSHGVYAQQEPYPCVNNDMFNVTLFLSLFMVLSWMIPSSLLVKNIVWEKEMRLKEMMKIMGLGDMIHWVAWAIQAYILNFFSILIIASLLKFGNILPHTDWSMLFVFFNLFALACIALCLLLSTFFSRSNVATACTAVLFFLFFFPYQLSVRSKSPTFTTLTLIFPQTAIGHGMTMIAVAEDNDNATWATINNIRNDDYGINLTHVMVALCIDCAIFTLLAWYISAVFPGKYGVASPWNFFLKKSYWVGMPVDTPTLRQMGSTAHLMQSNDFESDPSGLKLAVDIQKMDKVYGNNTKALDSLSVRFYESQITAFLGHNGAGKTTTISILSGLYAPTNGTAHVYGYDIRMEMRSIREFIGVCPQHNVLFDLMTVDEQLRFYGALKGISSELIDSEVDVIVRDIGLNEKRTALANELSGGMKRKLCIGIALIGGSKLVILDEPTAGIDAHARRAIWDLLLKHKEGRTMILSTHHMDEADVLADRIAIIAEGQLRTAGSSLFLKRRYGEGYVMTISKIRPLIDIGIPSSSTDLNDENDLDRFIRKKIPGMCEKIEDLGLEAIYKLSIDLSAEKLQDLFDEMETNLGTLGIESYGISAPSLQQIFLKVAPMDELKLKKRSGCQLCSRIMNGVSKLRKRNHLTPNKSDLTENADLITNDSSIRFDRNGGHPKVLLVTNSTKLRLHHARALFIKRWHNTRRSLLSLFCELILPLCLLLAAEIYSKTQTMSGTIMIAEDMLALTPVIYGNETKYYFGVWDQNTTGMEYLESMVDSPGLGVRCLDDIDIFDSDEFRCQYGYANGSLDLALDNPSKINYSVPQTCGCTPSSGWNCTWKDYPIDELQIIKLNTTDILYDLTYRNISQFRLMTYANTTATQQMFLGGWTFGHRNVQAANQTQIGQEQIGLKTMVQVFANYSPIINWDWENATSDVNWTTPSDPFNPTNLSVLDFYKNLFGYMDTEENIKIWFNNRMWASLPINTNSFYNAVLRFLRPSNLSADDIGILAINHPMNATVQDGLDTRAMQKTVMFRIVLLILVLCVVPSSFSMLLVDEGASYSKHLQHVFGVAPWMYWLTNFIYDFAIYFLCSCLIIFIYYVMHVELFTYSWDAVGATVLVFMLYGFCTLPFVYIMQMFFNVPALAFALISIGVFFVGVVTTMTVMLLENLQSADDGLETAHRVCSGVFLLVPQYNLGMAMYRLTFVYTLYNYGKTYLENIGRLDALHQLPLPEVMEWEMMGKHCLALFVGSLFYMALLALVEYRDVVFKFIKVWERIETIRLVSSNEHAKELDEDVAAEQRFVENIDDFDEYGLVVKKLSKSYNGKVLAVNNLSFAVKKGHCFGLLGVNGAGKTTTFSMLTKRLGIGSGDALIHGVSINDSRLPQYRLLGYCPQFDALNLKLTAREQLAFYCRIRGISEVDIDKVVNWAVQQMQLKPYANEVSGSYSGGNKRKLSAAMALVADPPVVLLDEPSSGMDPSSQQFMWNLILSLRRSNRTVIITSHSMEECEALCTKTAIMVNGQFECIGSIQHLKQKYGMGYTFTIKLASLSDVTQAKNFIEANILNIELQSVHCLSIFYRIKDPMFKLSNAFHTVALLRKLVSVEDYSLSQTTLDDVFVSFATKSNAKLKEVHENGNITA